MTADITMTLDGFISGPNDSLEHPLGVGGERIHRWQFELESWRAPQGLSGGKVNQDSEIIHEASKNVAATIVGRRMFDLAQEWGDDPPFHQPMFVVTHRAQEKIVKEGGTTFIFVTDGIESALKQARAAAGDKDVAIGGGASIVQQFIKAGLLDEIQLHIANVLLGGGTSLFGQLGTEHVELEKIRVVESPGVTHLKFRVGKGR